jgi:TPR repeat protein
MGRSSRGGCMFPSPSRKQPILDTRVRRTYTEILHEALSARDENDELNDIVRQALRWTRATGAAIALESHGQVVCRACAGETAPAKGATLEKDSGLSGLCLRTGSILVCEDAQADLRVSKEACRRLGIRSVVAVPVHGGNTSGVLEVFSREPQAFDDQAVAVLRNFGEAIDSTLNRAANDNRESTPARRAPTAATPEPQEPSHLSAYVIAACAAVMVGTLTPAAMTFREIVRVPPPPPIATVRVPYLSNPRRSAETRSQAVEDPLLKPATRLPVGYARGQQSPLSEADRQYQLATAFAEGRGVKQNLIEAYAWFVIAGANGNRGADAMIRSLTARMPESEIAQVRFRLGEIFDKGLGVPRDPVTSYFWYALAEAGGHPRAAAEERNLADAMTPTQVIEAKNRAARWLAQHIVKRQNG